MSDLMPLLLGGQSVWKIGRQPAAIGRVTRMLHPTRFPHVKAAKLLDAHSANCQLPSKKEEYERKVCWLEVYK